MFDKTLSVDTEAIVIEMYHLYGNKTLVFVC